MLKKILSTTVYNIDLVLCVIKYLMSIVQVLLAHLLTEIISTHSVNTVEPVLYGPMRRRVYADIPKQGKGTDVLE